MSGNPPESSAPRPRPSLLRQDPRALPGCEPLTLPTGTPPARTGVPGTCPLCSVVGTPGPAWVAQKSQRPQTAESKRGGSRRFQTAHCGGQGSQGGVGAGWEEEAMARKVGGAGCHWLHWFLRRGSLTGADGGQDDGLRGSVAGRHRRAREGRLRREGHFQD